MPELPEVETARAAIERAALHREIVDVDDTDTYVCRPHPVGELAAALVGRSLIAAHRRGKLMWCELDRPDGAAATSVLGLHLGMAGRIYVSSANGTTAAEGGDPVRDGPVAAQRVWDRFTLVFADGGALRLFDKRRLSRVRLDPDIDALGPDALTIGAPEFRAALGTSTTLVKARLLDQSVIAGVGNLLADEMLWQARILPAKRVAELTPRDIGRLYRCMQAAIESAVARGGVHTGQIIPYRHAGGRCPRCGAAMVRGVVGGRTTWWCSRDQR